MDEKIVEEILDSLFSSLEDLETNSAAILLFLKEQGIATEEKLLPYFEQAGKTSNVRWRAARVRTGALLASAMKSPEPVAEKKPATNQEKSPEPTSAGVDAEKPAKQTPEQKPEAGKSTEGAKIADESGSPGKDTVQPTQKDHAPQKAS